MQEIKTKIINGLLLALLVAGLAMVVYRLFLVDFLLERGGAAVTESRPLLRVLGPVPLTAVDPLDLDIYNRQVAVNVFEPLVGTDRDFNYRPVLASAYGLIDEKTWDFHLRSGVRFGGGVPLTVDFVADYFNGLRLEENMASLLGNIESVEAVGEVVRFRLMEVDPLFLNKISKILVAQNGLGTGPYLFDGEKFLRNEQYWGAPALYRRVEVRGLAEKQARIDAFLAGEADVLTFAPADVWNLLEQRGFELKAVPNLELQFLAFNLNGDLFADSAVRRSFALAADVETFVEELGADALAVNQFVSSGIFGFDERLKLEAEVDLSALKGKTVLVALPKGLDLLGEHLRKMFLAQEVFLTISYLEPADFLKNVEEGSADLYFLAFKSELADSQQFFEELALREAAYNFFGYEDETLERLAAEAGQELDVRRRQSLLKQMMEIVVVENPYGVPLFEYQNAFALRAGLDFAPRLDGLLFFNEIK